MLFVLYVVSIVDVIIVLAIIVFIYVVTMSLYTKNSQKGRRSFVIIRDNFLFLGINLGFISGILTITMLTTSGLLPNEIKKDDFRPLLTTDAIIISTILAVSFSISIFAIQHAVSSYSPSLLHYYLKDKATVSAFVLLAFSALLNLVGLVSPSSWNGYLSNNSLFTVGYGFLVLAFYFYNTSNTTSPIYLIRKLESLALKYINNLPEKLQRSLEEMEKQRTIPSSIMSSDAHREILEVSIFHSYKFLNEIENSIGSILGVMQKSLSTREKETIKEGLTSITTIIENYLKIRKPRSEDSIISSVYEHLKSIVVFGLDNKDVYVLNTTCDTYEEIGVMTTTIPKLGREDFHITTALAITYIKFLFDRSLERQLEDTASHAIDSIINISISSVRHGGTGGLAVPTLSEFVDNEKVKGNLFLARPIVNGLSKIAYASIEEQLPNHLIKYMLSHLEKSCLKIMTAIPSTEFLYSNLMFFIGSLDDMILYPYCCVAMVLKFILLKRNADPRIPIPFMENYLRDLAHSIVETLASITFAAIRIKNSYIVNQVSQSLLDILLLALAETTLSARDYFDSEIRLTVNLMIDMFKTFFKTNDDLDYDLLPTIPINITVFALNTIKYSKTKFSIEAANSLLELSFYVAAFEEYGYTAARIASKILRIAIYAADKNNVEVAKVAIKKLNEYDLKITDATNSPQPRQSVDKLRDLIDELKDFTPLGFTDNSLIFLKENLSEEAWHKLHRL